ncbi:MAG: tRNA epoxyqueuosine(34) reductase QueG [Candidatus Hinthialibacter antarcticus]|nr:tRNA epoxyqueuosine(34) reductase QueG [Candidatus Hinthialibacter antarcticus]
MDNAAIKARAIQLGFDRVGVAPPSPNTLHHYREWLANNFHGEMEYMASREPLRSAPNQLLENIQSVIVVAKRYKTVEFNALNKTPSGIIARYAWGDDYHDVLRPKLNELSDWLQHETNGVNQARAFVDSGPVLERDYAAQAGIGWFGKHTNILSREMGNWFFLGVVLTTLKLDFDAPVKAHCGTCTSCLDRCPTNAFVSPYSLDARRCISYLTIELKGPIPRDLRPLMGNRIFGCDDCLQACPWNRFAQPVDVSEFHPRLGLNPADLIELMKLDDATFRQRFKGSPILRTKRRGLLRNIAVALGNSGDARAIPALANALSDPEPLIRSHAAWALGRLGGKNAIQAIQSHQQKESDKYVLDELQFSLSNFQNRL